MKVIVWFLGGCLVLLCVMAIYYDAHKHPSRQEAFDSVVSAKADNLDQVHELVNAAKPSFFPGDDEFFSSYLKILDAGQFGTAEACRAEGMLRFHRDQRAMKALGIKIGTCAKRAADMQTR